MRNEGARESDEFLNEWVRVVGRQCAKWLGGGGEVVVIESVQ